MTVLELLNAQETDPAVIEARDNVASYMTHCYSKNKKPDELELRLLLDTVETAIESYHRKALADEILVDCD